MLSARTIKFWFLWLPILVFSWCSGCSQERQYEQYGDIPSSPGGLPLINPEEHMGGYGRTSCLVCHNADLNLHRGENSPVADIDQFNELIRENGESTYCLKCHEDNGTNTPTLGTNQVQLQPTSKKIIDNCRDCHLRKYRTKIPEKRLLTRKHTDISLNHGGLEISCNHCHDINNYNLLIHTEEFPATFDNSSPLCHRCHSMKYRDWKMGIHGKRMGGWSRSPIGHEEPLMRWQLHCIECHNSHSVSFKKMMASPVGPQRHAQFRHKFLIFNYETEYHQDDRKPLSNGTELNNNNKNNTIQDGSFESGF